jgi:cytochrome P450
MPTWIAQYGDVFMIRSFLGAATIVADPELARQVLVDRYARYQQKSLSYHVLRLLMGNGLVTSDGEFWRKQRKLVQPAFHRRRLDALFGMMTARVTHCAERLASDLKNNEVVDFAPLLSQLTLDVISRAMFSTDVQGSAADVSRHIAILNEYALHMLRHPWLFLLPRTIPTFFNHRPVNSLRSLNAIVLGIIQSRRKNPEAHDDLLTMLLTACEEETGRGMTDEQLRDEVMTVFVAGHETTANAMCWLLHLISQHPEVERQLVNEIETQCPGSELRADAVARCTYVRRVIEESLRVFPTIWSIGRRCTEADELGGFSIPVGMNVVIPIFYFHSSPRFWDQPERFDPDRFSPERRPTPESMIYFPFGAGPRSCIGNHFALQELMIMTIVLLRRFRFSRAPDFIVEADPLITLRPKHGMRMRVQPREQPAGVLS